VAKKDPTTDWLGRVTDYLYWRARDAASRVEFEDFTLSLAIIGLCRENVPHPYEMAFIKAFGTHRQRFLTDRAFTEWATAKMLYEDAQVNRRSQEVPKGGEVRVMPAKDQPVLLPAARAKAR
jgi:hypothetical protein